MSDKHELLARLNSLRIEKVALLLRPVGFWERRAKREREARLKELEDLIASLERRYDSYDH